MVDGNPGTDKKSDPVEGKPKADVSDLYPGRKESQDLPKRFAIPSYKNGNYNKIKCETNVYRCIKESPLIKLLLGALKASGCEIDIGRHISCEVCDTSVTGGYDPVTNQVIICQNTATGVNKVHSTLSHELIHMFDYCRNHVDQNNIRHLACTEIRAANLCHCSFLGAMMRRTASPLNIRQMHQECVLDKAVRSIVAIKNVSREEAEKVAMEVFNKCYNDLEPIGRRIRRKSNDMKMAYLEGSLYGYVD